MNTKRKTYIDVLRILACFFVLYNHRPGYTLYMNEVKGPSQWVLLGISMFTRMNVPVFLMISGALLLGKSETSLKETGRRFLRIFTALVIFSSILYVITTPSEERAWHDLFEKIFAGKLHASYWYLYCYLGFILMLPFLRILSGKLDQKLMLYLLALHFVSASLFKGGAYLYSLYDGRWLLPEGHFTFAMATERNLFYPLFGYYLSEKLPGERVTGRFVLCLSGLALAGIFISSVFTVHQGVHTGTYTQDFVMLFDYMTAGAVFTAARFWCGTGGGGHGQRLISSVGVLTFGMYLMDPIWRALFGELADETFSGIFPGIVPSLVWCLLSMTLSGLLTFLLKKIPFIRNIL